MENKKTNIIETILSHPFAFAMVVHTTMELVNFVINKGKKISPIFVCNINSRDDKSSIKTTEG